MANIPMRLVMVFKASHPQFFPRSDAAERRIRCRRCGFVNVFCPLQEPIASLIV